jgi:hypothetical protein
MMRQFVQITLLTGTLLVGLVPLARGTTPGGPPRGGPGPPRVVARVTAVNPKTGVATLKTTDGEVFRKSKYVVGKVGSEVECDRIDDGPAPQLRNCQPWK